MSSSFLPQGVLSGVVAIIALIPISIHHPERFANEEFQPLFNLAGLGVTLGIAILSGVVTGGILFGLSFINKIFAEDYFNDRTFWVLPSDYEWVVREEADRDI